MTATNLPRPEFDEIERKVIGQWVKEFLERRPKTADTGTPKVYIVSADDLAREMRRQGGDDEKETKERKSKEEKR